jgi:anti-anti-sigma regulatory factor
LPLAAKSLKDVEGDGVLLLPCAVRLAKPSFRLLEPPVGDLSAGVPALVFRSCLKNRPEAYCVTTTTKTRRPLEVFALDSELDRANLESLRAQLECRLESTLLLDMTAVTYVDGAFLSLLMDILDRLGEAGFLGVAGPHKRIQQLFAFVGLGDLPRFQVYSTLEEALEAARDDAGIVSEG